MIIYLLIGFLLDLYIEYIINNIPTDILNVTFREYDIDIYNKKIRFIMLIICMIGWPFIIMNIFKDN